MNIFKDIMVYIISLLMTLSITLGTQGVFLNSNWGDSITTKWETPTIPFVDLSESAMPEDTDEDLKYLYTYQDVERGTTEDTGYYAHPDSVLLNDGSILQVYPQGHGRGAIKSKISTDGGLTWGEGIQNTPESWENSQETPTIYRLNFVESDREDMLILISANPSWGELSFTGGFNSSVSQDEGKTWTEFKTFNTKYGIVKTDAIVAMSSLTQLKEDGEFVDKWMGTYHDKYFHNYTTILTIDENGNEHWSEPVRYLDDQRMQEVLASVCEVEVIRSEQGQGDELCMIARSQTKVVNSLVAFSQDEGKTWSDLKPLPSSLNGERFKAEYIEDGRLVITFRSISRNESKAEDFGLSTNWYSKGLLMWVGTYDDLKQGNEGEYVVKLAHTFMDEGTESIENAHADTGYCGVTVVEGNTVNISSYGRFDGTDLMAEGYPRTFIMSKTVNIDDIDTIVNAQ